MDFNSSFGTPSQALPSTAVDTSVHVTPNFSNSSKYGFYYLFYVPGLQKLGCVGLYNQKLNNLV